MAEVLEFPSPSYPSGVGLVGPRYLSGPDGIPEVLARAGDIEVLLATDGALLEATFRLRYRVMCEEFGGCPGAAEMDQDLFDQHCLHLIARDRARDRVVGTYRVLLPAQARRLGCLYSDAAFWLTRLNPLREELVELGRACVHPDYRNGLTIMLLWSALGALMARTGHRLLIGCASISMSDGGALAASIYRQVQGSYLSDETLRVWPRRPLAVDNLPLVDGRQPPLLKAYLRAGAQVLGVPHVDGDFGCADFPLLLDIDRLAERYRRRFVA